MQIFAPLVHTLRGLRGEQLVRGERGLLHYYSLKINEWQCLLDRPSPPSIQLSVGGRVSC